jgi:acrylyl-CoA reductase (NADPH)
VTFNAIYLENDDNGVQNSIHALDESALPKGDVRVGVEYSTINYKDGLAITGAGPVVRSYPMVPGIDLAGKVLESSNPEFKEGDAVVLNGWGVGERHWGGLSQQARLSGDWLIKLPSAFTSRQAMAIGTAGYTAMLCVMAIERAGVRPDSGTVLVTGAAGGVGSVAIALLAKLGYTVEASTGRASEEAYLKGLGASSIVDRNELSEKGRPVGKERWAGAVDAVGSHTLANVLAQTQYGGAVAACGLAQGGDLPTSVYPFILRGVSLLGVDSVMAPKPVREAAWQRLAQDLDMSKLEAMIVDMPLADAPAAAAEILKGQIRGRVVVDVNA